MKKRDVLAMLIVAASFLTGAILVTILLSKILFTSHVWQLDTQQVVGVSLENVLINYDMLIHYLLNPFNTLLALPNFEMSSSGIFHFYEVKQLFLLNNSIFLISLLGSVGVYWYIKKMYKWDIFKKMSQILFVIPIILSIVLVAGFDYWFVVFHQIVFNNNDWLFNPVTDPIILVLPETFFMSCFIMIISLFELFTLLWWLHCRFQCAKINKKRQV